MKRVFRALSVSAVALAAFGFQARADVVLTGPDSNDGSYSTAALSAAAGSNTVNSGGLTGISLWEFLGGANAASKNAPVYGAITTSTPAGDNPGNAILRYYLVASNATGQQSVVSLGEIDPRFGGASVSPAPFIAFQHIGSGLLASPELILPAQPGRDLTNLTSLQILSVPALSGPPKTTIPSTAVQLTGNVSASDSYTLAKLQNFTPFTETVAGDTYTGVPLWTFLNPTENSLNQIVTFQATDGYEVVTALAELDPSLGAVACAPAVTNCDILPYADTGTNFTTGGDGVARVIFPGDTSAQGRWGSDLTVISVVEAPEPGTLVLLSVGLVGIVSARRRSARRFLE